MRHTPAGFFLAAVVASTLAAPPLFAQSRPPAGLMPIMVQGDYEGRGGGELSMRTLVLDDYKGVVAANIGVGTRGCAGNFTGIGELKGNTLRLRPYTREPESAACMITVTFDASGKTAAMEESSCLFYHGAACEFSGKLIKKR